MSAPVDVLAVVDRAFGAAQEHYYDLRSAAEEPPLGPAYKRSCRYMKEHREARAAVAELIEAAQAVENSCVRHDANDADLFRRLDAAIARVKGETA